MADLPSADDLLGGPSVHDAPIQGSVPDAHELLGPPPDAWSGPAPDFSKVPLPPIPGKVTQTLDKLGVAGPIETAARLGSSMLAQPAAGVASLYEMATSPRGLKTKNAAQASQAVEQALTYEPRTESGKEMSGATGRVLGLLGGTEGDWLKNKLLQYTAGPQQMNMEGKPYMGEANLAGANPYLAAGADVAANIPAVLLGARLGAGRTVGRAATPEMAEATGAGIRVAPENGLGETAASLAGAPQLEHLISKKNVQTINNLAKDDIGVPRDRPLNEANLNGARAPHDAVYDEVSNLGTINTNPAWQSSIDAIESGEGRGTLPARRLPQTVQDTLDDYRNVSQFDAGDAVLRVRQLRKEANQALGGPYNPENQVAGYAYRRLADALEDQIDSHVQQLTQPIQLPNGQTIIPSSVPPDLLPRLRNARTQLAKIQNVEDSLVGPNVDAAKLLNVYNRGAPLTGNLGIIARARENFGRSLISPQNIRYRPISYFDAAIGTGGAFATGNPHFLAGILGRPILRHALASDLYQRYGLRNPQVPLSPVGAVASEASQQEQEP